MNESLSEGLEDSAPPPVSPPEDTPVERTRMLRSVRAQLFGGEPEVTRIGRFRLLECIGRGGMGVVWSAHDDELDRTVAIKLLRPELSGHDLTAEARALAKLSHPNVVSVFDVGVHEDQRFIAMEFVEGTTLRTWLAEPRSPSEVIEVFINAGLGLAAAHAVGLVHRDFKPDNVLVGRDGRPRVLDFGLARAPGPALASPPVLPAGTDPFATTVTVAGFLIGTPAYMAPEQHLGDPADARSDQFAFGIALYEGLAGTMPFPGEDLRTLSLAVVRGRFADPPPGSIPAPVLDVIARALSPQPEARFATIVDMLAALRQTLTATDPRFDTQQVDLVLGRAAELQAASSGRPGLSATELEEVAVEAGIEARHARQAASEALAVQPPAPISHGVSPVPVVPATKTFGGLGGFRYDVTVSHPITTRLAPGVALLLVREMERRCGAGKTDRLGSSTTWQRRGIELHIDPTAHGATLTLRQELGSLDRSRPYRYGVLGFILAVSTVVPLAETLLPRGIDGVMVVIVFASMVAGALAGRTVGHRLHQRALSQHKETLDATAARLVAIAKANS